jgi:DNA polymerase-3 subunit delta'
MLEEPPDKTYFIFVASDKDELIDTVKSRLEGIHVKEKISAQISETPNRNKDLDYAFATNTEESPDNDNFKKFQTWMRACHSKNIVELNDLNLEISKRKKGGYLSFMTFCVNKLSFCCRYVVQNKDGAQSNEEMVFIRKFCKHLKLKTLVLLLEEIESSIYYLERNANSKILFLSLSINLFKIFDEN